MIEMLVCDVDGTLTDGSITYGSNGVELKAFSAKDGLILHTLPRLGIQVVFLTGRDSEMVSRRASDIDASAIQGIDDKLPVLNKLLEDRKIKPDKCAYIGDDLNDLNAMRICGFKACPADAAREIRAICDYVSPYMGGHGAVRDICENILLNDGKYDRFLTIRN